MLPLKPSKCFSNSLKIPGTNFHYFLYAIGLGTADGWGKMCRGKSGNLCSHFPENFVFSPFPRWPHVTWLRESRTPTLCQKLWGLGSKCGNWPQNAKIYESLWAQFYSNYQIWYSFNWLYGTANVDVEMLRIRQKSTGWKSHKFSQKLQFVAIRNHAAAIHSWAFGAGDMSAPLDQCHLVT